MWTWLCDPFPGLVSGYSLFVILHHDAHADGGAEVVEAGQKFHDFSPSFNLRHWYRYLKNISSLFENLSGLAPVLP